MLDPNAALETCFCMCPKARSAPRNSLVLGCDALGQVVNLGCRLGGWGAGRIWALCLGGLPQTPILTYRW